MADKVLDFMRFNQEWTGITWENCTLRKWLNENFLNEAFTPEEKGTIIESNVVNQDNNVTKDIYIISR